MKFGVIPTFLTVTLALTGLLVGAYLNHQETTSEADNEPLIDCDISRTDGCRIPLPEHDAVIRFHPAPVALRPFDVLLAIRPPIERASIQFDMIGMSMGVNRLDLTLRTTADQWQEWIATAVLPTCKSGRKDWLARIEVGAKTDAFAAVMPFRLR